jgi:CRISPR-associated endonuclease/helicase Cas3
MLGRKVMISSATIPPDLALGFFNAYKEGWQIFAIFLARVSLTKPVQSDMPLF